VHRSTNRSIDEYKKHSLDGEEYCSQVVTQRFLFPKDDSFVVIRFRNQTFDTTTMGESIGRFCRRSLGGFDGGWVRALIDLMVGALVDFVER
jgi:hypothetical protein